MYSIHTNVIQTTNGRKNLGNINEDILEILRYALDDRVEALDDRVGDYTSSRF